MNKEQNPGIVLEDLTDISVTKPEQLSAVLKAYGVDFSKWGRPPYKSVDRLFKEIEDGESRLVHTGSAIGRLVAVAHVDIRASIAGRQYRLLEDRQEFAGGGELSTRKRGLYGVSEKIQGSEEPVDAARRGIQEELEIAFASELTPGERGMSFKESSHSYPGLAGIYVTHNFTAQFGVAEWNAKGYEERQPDKTTYFIWEEQ